MHRQLKWGLAESKQPAGLCGAALPACAAPPRMDAGGRETPASQYMSTVGLKGSQHVAWCKYLCVYLTEQGGALTWQSP